MWGRIALIIAVHINKHRSIQNDCISIWDVLFTSRYTTFWKPSDVWRIVFNIHCRYQYARVNINILLIRCSYFWNPIQNLILRLPHYTGTRYTLYMFNSHLTHYICLYPGYMGISLCDQFIWEPIRLSCTYEYKSCTHEFAVAWI